MMKQRASIANKMLMLLIMLAIPLMVSSKSLLSVNDTLPYISSAQEDATIATAPLDSLIIQISQRASAFMKLPGIQGRSLCIRHLPL